MAHTFKYVLQDTSTGKYLVSEDTWSSDISQAKAFNAVTDLESLPAGNYIQVFLYTVTQ